MSTADTDIEIHIAQSNDTVEVTVVGEIDSSNCHQLNDALAALATSESAGTVHVDMAAVDFIDSSGLRALLVGRRAIVDAGGTMHVTATSPNVARLFEITGLTDHLR